MSGRSAGVSCIPDPNKSGGTTTSMVSGPQGRGRPRRARAADKMDAASQVGLLDPLEQPSRIGLVDDVVGGSARTPGEQK